MKRSARVASTFACIALALAWSGALAACFSNDDIPAPRIANVVPDHAPAGTVVMVAGSYFCQVLPTEDPTCDIAGTVLFGTTPGTPSTWSDTAIMVEVPQGVLGKVGVSVTVKGRASNHVDFLAE